MSDQQKYESSYQYTPEELEEAIHFEDVPAQEEQPVSDDGKHAPTKGPRRAMPTKKGVSLLSLLLVCCLAGLAFGGGFKLCQTLSQSSALGRPDVQEPEEADPDFGFDFGGDVEINNEASSEYTLPAYEGDSSGLTIRLDAPGTLERTPVELYREQLPATVSITVYAGNSAAYGSGMILTHDGFILTCAHVIEDTETCMVTLWDDRKMEAELVGSDRQTDLAVLKIEAKNLPCVTFCDSDRLEIGEAVYTIGDPLGPQFRSSISNGILSGLDRSISSNSYAMTLMQITAPVNSGNSGGPLFNRFGQVIGVVNMKMSNHSFSSASIDNMGLSIPSQTVKQVVEELAKHGSIVRPVLGITCYTLDEVTAHVSGVPEGLWVVTIREESDCAAQGLLIGDLITEADGVPVRSVPQFQRIIAQKKPGDTVTLTVWRDEALAEKARLELEKGDSSEESDPEASTSAEGSTSEEPEEVTYHFEYLGDMKVKLIGSDELE